MFRLNNLTRILRNENDGDGNDLGGGAEDINLFAGGDDDWEESSLGFIDDNADLSQLGNTDSHQKPFDHDDTGEPIDDGEIDDDGDVDGDGADEDSEHDDEENPDSDSDADDDNIDDDIDDDGGDDDDELTDDSDDETDDDSDSDDDDADDGDSDDESGGDNDDSTSENAVALKAAQTALANYRKEAQSAHNALADALGKLDNFEKNFNEEHSKLYEELDSLNLNYQDLVSNEASKEELAEAYGKVMAKNREIMNLQSTRQSELTASKTEASAQVRQQLNSAIAQAGKIYPQLDGKGDKRSDIHIRLVNQTFQDRIKDGTVPVVKAFVDVVEEVALQLKLDVADEFKTTESAKKKQQKKATNKTEKSIKKRVKAAKKTPVRKKANSDKSKVTTKDLSKLTGDKFAKNEFVTSIGIDMSQD